MMQRTSEQLIDEALKLERPPPELDDNTLSHGAVMFAVVRALNTKHHVWIPIDRALSSWRRADRYAHLHAKPAGDEHHYLVKLQEECAEVIQRAAKSLQFGSTECEADEFRDNAFRLANELGDLLGVMDLLVQGGYLDESKIDLARKLKPFRMEAWR